MAPPAWTRRGAKMAARARVKRVLASMLGGGDELESLGCECGEGWVCLRAFAADILIWGCSRLG